MGKGDCETLTVGTELVLGQLVDTNAADLSRALAAAGWRVRRHASVPDELALVAEAVREALERTELLVITGGLGPTRDDLTKQAVAGVLGRPMVRDESLLERLREMFRRRGMDMPESNASQADVPTGATVLRNLLGTAPGLWLEDGDGRVVVMLPGVPKEMRGLLEAEVIPRLIQREGAGAQGHRGTVVRSRTLRTTGISESALADRLAEYEKLLGPAITLASLPSLDGTDLRLTAWTMGLEEADHALGRAMEQLRPLAGDAAYGEDGDDLAAVVLSQLESQGVRLAVAESCTGGLLGARLTAVAGSSRVFVGGVVAYDNEVKLGLLGVSADTLAAHGAVSEAVAREMADGVSRVLGAEAGLAVTGIAGPDGGTGEKPVGTVWIAVRWKDWLRAFTFVFPGDREDVRRRAAQWALDRLRRVALGLT